ncbi:FAD-binding oxidoreductase [Tautonia rosea]|uniref:FAD-binding oxidoreductase n=1 Tax=Tautonia rosea TaxID=2728037 RepID=UPI00147549DD|nr:FAD-binding oxidoreductase [Tautonia rosea]
MNWPDTSNEFPLGDGRFGSAVERPTDRESLAACVLKHVSDGAAIYPQGGRTALETGGPPDRPGIVLDVQGLSRVIDYPVADMTVTVEAGMTLAALQQLLRSEGQRLPLHAPFAERATLGAIYATDTSGPTRFGLGRPRDQIIGVAFVTSHGAVVKGGGRVVKNVAGYDFPKLLTGSYGSLGTIVELTLKTRPMPESTAMIWTQWPSSDRLEPILAALNTSRSRPVVFELLNAPAAESVSRDAELDLPTSGQILIMGVEGTSDVVQWQLDVLGAELAAATDRIEVRDADADRLLQSLTSHPAEEAAMSFKASLLPSAMTRFLAEVDPERWASQCHAGSGVVWGLALSSVPIVELAEDISRFRDLAVASEGNLILPRCPTDRKGDLGVWGYPRGDWELARMIKRSLDPAGAMNPGRFL